MDAPLFAASMERCRFAVGAPHLPPFPPRFRLSHGGAKTTQWSVQLLKNHRFPSSLHPTFSRSFLKSSCAAASSRASGFPASDNATSFSSFSISLASKLGSSKSRRVGYSQVESPSVCCRSNLTTEGETSTETILREDGGGIGSGGDNGGGGGGGGGGGDAIGWISSALVFALWGGFIIYTFTGAPNQTPSRDMYFVEKLLFLHQGDGFEMNRVLVAEWFTIAHLTFLYSSLLLPTGRSCKDGIKVGPFVAVSFAVGSLALLPYFALWQPPPPALSRDELRRFPLNILESKITAVATIIAGVVLAAYAGFPGNDWQWAEFFQYIRESRFIHVMSIDFVILVALFPFWVYNDLTVRQGSDKLSWLVPFSVVPYFGVPLYLLLRPPLPSTCILDESTPKEN